MRLPQPGEAVGPYTCVRLLASGGMGAVYEARHPDLPRSVALKLLLAPEDPELVTRFRRESEACGRLSHPNLVRVHDSGRVGQACYLVMELVKGESLQAQLDRGGPFEPQVARKRIEEAAEGIAHAHAAGVLHRDLKPSNLLWDQELGRVRVVDFGLTGRLSAADSLTATGEVLGTPGYLAPEQVGVGEGVIGPATDVYGLGATLFALLTGRAPFVGAGMAGLAEVATDSAPDVRSLRGEIDPDLAAIVARCLLKDPELRYPSASDLVDVLAGRVEATPVASSRRSQRLSRLLGGGLILTLALATGVGVVVGSSTGPSLEERLGDYQAWRREALAGFAYGWGSAAPDLEQELEVWSEELSAASSRGPEWEAAAGEVRAHLRLLSVQEGRDLGFPAPDSTPPPGSADHLAQAVVSVQRGRSEGVEASLGEVEGRLAKGAELRVTREALVALVDPRAFLEDMSGGEGAARAMLERCYPLALQRAAPTATQAELVRWVQSAGSAGCASPGVALREAVRASLPQREEELNRLELEELPRYLRQLCAPIRQAGLWPDSGFAKLCRERLKRESGPGSAAGRMGNEAVLQALIRVEHEVFYRVEAQPCWLAGFRFLMNFASSMGVDPQELPILVRSLHRYGLQPGGYGLGLAQAPGPLAFAAHPEPEGRLKEAYAWWVRHEREAQPKVGACSAALTELEQLLQREVDDLHPGLVFELFQLLRAQLARRPADDPADRAQEAARLSKLAWMEFERALKWLRLLPSEGAEDQVALSAELTGHAWLLLPAPEGPRHEVALSNYAKAIDRIRAVAVDSGPKERAALDLGLRKTFGNVGRIFLELRCPKLALELLASGEQDMTRGERSHAEFLYFWGALLTAYRDSGQNSRAVGLIDEVGLVSTSSDHWLAVPLSEVLIEAKRGAEAIPVLQRARARALGSAAAGKLLPGQRDGLLGRLDELLALCEAQR